MIGVRHILELAAGIALTVSATAQTSTEGFTGSDACSGCHSQQAESQAVSAHALSLARPLDHRLASEFRSQLTLRRQPAFDYRWLVDDDQFAVTVSDGEESVDLVVDWAFGAADQAVTFVSRLDDDWYLEHHWSYYSAAGGFDTTPGHQGQEAQDLQEALGVRYRTFSPKAEILRCFRCHSTGPLAISEVGEIQPSELGVRCEACHGPGVAHVAAMADGRIEDGRHEIVNPGRLEPAELLTYCGNCHRPPSADPADIDYNDPWNVRHQPVYLSRSSCFSQSAELTCMSCHDPHDRVRRNDASYYRSRCATCHTADQRPIARACGNPQNADCVSCHMPKVRPHENLAFTNHWIGVFDDAKSFVPRR